MSWQDGVWPGASMTLSSGAFLSGDDGYVCLPISTDSQLPRFYLTLNCTEKPREENRTKLSDVLEDSVDEKYSLSARACQGILARAEKKGKDLPEELRKALERQVEDASESHGV